MACGVTAADAQTCPEGQVGQILVDRVEPFSGDAVADGARLGWWFRTMNAVHVRTLESTVLWELMFDEESCFDPVLLAESERSLRSLSYISDAAVTTELSPEGSRRVHVQTHDAWAVAGGLALSFDAGISLTGISGSVNNVLGTGTQVSLFRSVFRERERRGLLVRQPNLFGSRVDATVHGGSTRSGGTFTQSLLRPYAGEVGSNAVRQTFHRRDDYFSYAGGPSADFTQAYVRFEAEAYEATYQRRFGRFDGTRLVVGAGFSREVVAFPAGAGGVLVVRDDNFGDPVQAQSAVVDALADQMTPWSTNRLNATVGVRRATFVRRTGLDAISAPQDVIMGGEFLLTAAPAVSSGRDDWLFRGQGTFGAGGGGVYGQLRAVAQGRRVSRGSVDDPSRWRDMLFEVEGISYWTQGARYSLVSRMGLSAGTRMDRPFQLTLGGREAVRGYQNGAFPGARRLLATLEQRSHIPALSTGFADVGFSVFADVGRMWAGAAPFGGDSGWRASAGGGLRLGLPGGGIDVVRMDIGVPLSGQDVGHGVVLRISAELFGLLDRRSWPSQMDRSRWHGVDADLATRPVNPLASN